MELRHLRYLTAIADAGAFVRAAEELHVAQPALTRQMHDLERELGAPLFDSKARRATLTPAGQACARLARHVIHDTEQAVARARLSNSGVIGKCVVSAGPVPIVSGLLPRFINRMRARFPGITISVMERQGLEQWTALERAEADIGMGIEPTESHPMLSMATQFLHVIDHIAIASDHPLARKASVSLRDLRRVPLLVPEEETPSIERVLAAVVAGGREQGLEFGAPRRFPSLESLYAHVRAGQGWTPVIASMRALLTGLAIVPITGFKAVFPTARIWRRAESRPVVLTVLDQLRRFQDVGDGESPDAPVPSDAERELVPPRLELRHLRTFVAVSRYGSLGRAAEALDVTQPALSRQMRELEYDVGVALLERETRGMDLTVAGETFRDDVASVLTIVDKIPREIRRAERARSQRCVIATVPHPAADAIVARTMADLESRHERVRVGVRSIVSPSQAEALRSGEVDVALSHAFPVPAPITKAEHLISLPLVDDRISAALLPPDHPLAARKGLRVRELADIPFIFVSRDFHPGFYDAVFAAFAAARLTPRVEGEFEGLTTIWSLVAQGSGWAMGWRSHLRQPPAGLTAVPLRDFDLPWGLVMTYRQDESRAPILATIDALAAQAKRWNTGPTATEATLPTRHTRNVSIS